MAKNTIVNPCRTCGTLMPFKRMRYCSENCKWLDSPSGRKWKAKQLATSPAPSLAPAKRVSRPPIPNRIRLLISARDHGLCRYCGAPGNSLDHVIPYSRGGPDTPDNLVLACMVCNLLVKALQFPSFVGKRAWVRAQRGLRSVEYENKVLSLCINCFTAFAPRVGKATIFLCPECAPEV
jgi:hypothetical protein